ncbi:MAG: hypothetical protein U1F51_16665 [Burkholderiales bacterium]
MSVEIFLLLAAVVVGLGILVRRRDLYLLKDPEKKRAAGPPTIQGARPPAYPGAGDDPMTPPPSAARAFSAGAAKFVAPVAIAVAVAGTKSGVGNDQSGADADAQRAGGDGAGNGESDGG